VGALWQFHSILPPGDSHWRGPLHFAAQHYGLPRDHNVIARLHSKCQFSREAQTCIREGEMGGKMLVWSVECAPRVYIPHTLTLCFCDINRNPYYIYKTLSITKSHPMQYFT
jgi:hypothetical protein